MKKIKIMLVALTLCLMHQFAAAQNCKGDKVLMSKGSQGCGCHCQKKCVSPADVQTYLNNGWRYGDCWGSCCWLRLNGNSSSTETHITEIYSNPASGSTIISFSLSQSRKVSLKIFDMNDRLVSTVADRIFKEGKNEFMWNNEHVKEGTFFLQFQSDENQERVKLVVTK
ncbi:MAG: T9SS type A sorting domain-containing protein [Ferruginibacter sp.]